MRLRWLCVVVLLLSGQTLFFVSAKSKKDYYEVLQIDRSADDATIKKAYRKLAVRMHPDKVQGTEEEKKKASEEFAELSHAYEVLSDPEKRKIYDRYGEEGLKSAGQGGHHSAEDIFSQFFGNFGFGFGHEEHTPRGDDVYAELEVTLKDLYLGGHFRIIRDKDVLKPAPGKRQCNCKQKVVTRQIGAGMYQQFTTRECEECDQVKLERVTEALTVSIDQGMKDGHQITFSEEGEPLVDGEPGDLILVVKQLPHPQFKRKGDDLILEESISLVDALVGFDREVVHLDGRKVKLLSTNITRPGDWQRIPGEGMPKSSGRGRGDLFVRYNVGFPSEVSDKQKKLIQDLFPEDKTKWIAHDEL